MPSDVQRRIRRSPLLFTTPLVLLVLLAGVLIWEMIRVNVSPGARAEWPWRLQLIDVQILGSLLAVAAGAVLARAQFARAMRPHIGWRGAWVKGQLAPDVPAWRVGILNGGQHLAVIESWSCRVVMRGMGDDADGDPRWADVHDTVAELTGAGLVVGEDFRLIGFGAGFPLVGGGGHETVLVGAFSENFTERVQALYVRARFTDVVGDTHERIMDCMKGLQPSGTVSAVD
ncbi:hypothetical protein [Streptomyces sp. ML-6]|uniref:hypothetical protein n=1 Tax=Streptomyces sp. ML-6 TaxID=2982693 RepID=UPI0024C08D20|nr:hypothetical protein [Streptomyces sp. ML-6]MDK0518650.1 hypothetical protein [Streptomyces sp. ML-6]